MKPKALFTVLMFLAFTISSCEKIKEERDALVAKSKQSLDSVKAGGLDKKRSSSAEPRNCPSGTKEKRIRILGEKSLWCASKGSAGELILSRFQGGANTENPKLAKEIVVDSARYQYRSFNQEGELAEEGRYLNEKKVGVWTSFYPDGSPKARISWRGGKKHGPAEEFSSNRQRIAHYSYQGGKLHGAYFKYHPDGSLAEHGTYAYGEKSGSWRAYDPSGKLISSETYKQGQPVSSNLTSHLPFSEGDKLGSAPRAPRRHAPSSRPPGEKTKDWQPVEQSSGWKSF